MKKSEKIKRVKKIYERHNYSIALQKGREFGLSRVEIDKILNIRQKKGIGAEL